MGVLAVVGTRQRIEHRCVSGRTLRDLLLAMAGETVWLLWPRASFAEFGDGLLGGVIKAHDLVQTRHLEEELDVGLALRQRDGAPGCACVLTEPKQLFCASAALRTNTVDQTPIRR